MFDIGFYIQIIQIRFFLLQLLGLRMFSKDTSDFFINIINDSIKLREEGKIVQQDMIHLLLEAKREYEVQQEKGKHFQYKHYEEKLLQLKILQFSIYLAKFFYPLVTVTIL